MTEFTHQDLRGSTFFEVDLAGAVFDNVDLTGAQLIAAELVDVEMHGRVHNLRINGVDVGPMIEAELNRRDPGRVDLLPPDADGFRSAWAAVERAWLPTLERARQLPPELLHERVDGEWSFVQTLRHLVFGIDCWVKRALLGDPSPYDPLSLPFTQLGDVPGVPNEVDARPSLDEVLALRADRTNVLRTVLADLTDDALPMKTIPNSSPGFPPPIAFKVRHCLQVVLNEDWHHRQFAERDLAILEKRF